MIINPTFEILKTKVVREMETGTMSCNQARDIKDCW